MNGTARAFWIERPGAGEIREQKLPSLRSGEVLIDTLYTAISRGTERLIFSGAVPASEYQRMSCPHQEGQLPGPVKYGYSNVGRVSAGPSDSVGQLVFCLYPHQTRYIVPYAAVVPLPSGVPPERAVLAANLETALNALWDAAPLFGDRVSIIGAGVLGALCAYLLRNMAGTDVELIDADARRAALAERLGVHFASPERARDDRDIVIHATGSAAGLRRALELAATDGTIVELSWFGDQQVELPLGQAFHVRRLTLRASQVGTVSPRARPRFSHRQRLELAVALCKDELLDALISGESAFDALPHTLPRVVDPASNELCHRVRYG